MKTRYLALAAFILLAAATRMVPHPSNFAPITAIALFGGVQFRGKAEAFLVPLAAMFLSDLVLGFHSQMAGVYLSFALIVLIGRWVRGRKTASGIAGGALAGSVLFFLLTNFGVWVSDGMYPKTAQGLLQCYVAAIPFFENSLLGDAFFSLTLFGGFALAERYLPRMREEALSAAS